MNIKIKKPKISKIVVKNRKCLDCGRPLILGNTTSDISSKWCDACYYK